MDNESNMLNQTELAKTKAWVIKRYFEDYRLKLNYLCQDLHIHKSIQVIFLLMMVSNLYIYLLGFCFNYGGWENALTFFLENWYD